MTWEAHIPGDPIEGTVPSLTPRERAVASLVADERLDKEIADTLGISEATTKYVVRRLLTKLRVRSRVGIALAMVEGGRRDGRYGG